MTRLLLSLTVVAITSNFALAQNRIGTGSVDEIYQIYCASCHGKNLAGGQGGSLVDDTWKHGSSDAEITKSIAAGFPDLGMVPWQGVLDDEQIRALVIYIREQGQIARTTETTARTQPQGGVFSTSQHNFTLEKITQVEDILWSMAFMPDNSILLVQRDGPLWRHAAGVNHLIEGTPEVWQHGQGGLLEVALHPDYADNGWIYLGYSENIGAQEDGKDAGMTAIVRGRIKDDQWIDQEDIFRVPGEFHTSSGVHFGTRFVFQDGYLFFSIGDRGRMEMAQDVTKPNGKIHRIFDDGRIPPHNPFASQPDAYPSLWTLGNRNAQGLDIDPATGLLWETEHGPRGGDEVNLIEPGVNYGWPEITYGMNYNGTPITDQTARDGLAQPAHYWNPSIAVCGIDFYEGDKFPAWNGDLFVSGMASQQLHRLVIRDGEVIADEIVLKGQGRVRDVLSGPDGHLYVALNSRDPNYGELYRLNPVPAPQWQSLFDGHSLDGWDIVNGSSAVLVDDGAIIAVNQDATAMTYLVTEQTYSDFILELDVKVIGDLNSGILLRGQHLPEVNDGRAHGYQMEIDQSPRQWTGGIYEEGGRGWLYSLEDQETARAAYEPSAWNHYRIEAIGPTFRIWVNGVPTLHLLDDHTAAGTIGFQIHRLTKGHQGGAVYLRNIRILTDEPVNHHQSTALRAKDIREL